MGRHKQRLVAEYARLYSDPDPNGMQIEVRRAAALAIEVRWRLEGKERWWRLIHGGVPTLSWFWWNEMLHGRDSFWAEGSTAENAFSALGARDMWTRETLVQAIQCDGRRL